MKRALAVLLLAAVACQGMQQRSDAMGTIASIYATVIQPVVMVGIGAEEDSGRLSLEEAQLARTIVADIGRMLEGRDPAQAVSIASLWERLLPYANAGIDAQVTKGDIGPGVASSLKETLRLFGERLVQVRQ